MYPQPNLEHHRPHLNEYNHMRATSLSIMLTWAYAHYACPPKFLLRLSSIVSILYLVPFLMCTPLFSSWHYHFPTPALYLRLYLLQLVIWFLDLCFSCPCLHHLLLIHSLLLLYIAHPLSQTHCLVSHSLYISPSYLLYRSQFEYLIWHLSLTIDSSNLMLWSPYQPSQPMLPLPWHHLCRHAICVTSSLVPPHAQATVTHIITSQGTHLPVSKVSLCFTCVCSCRLLQWHSQPAHLTPLASASLSTTWIQDYSHITIKDVSANRGTVKQVKVIITVASTKNPQHNHDERNQSWHYPDLSTPFPSHQNHPQAPLDILNQLVS